MEEEEERRLCLTPCIVYSRGWCLSARRVSFQLFPMAKETGFSASFVAANQQTSLHLVSKAATSLSGALLRSFRQGRRALARAVAESFPVDNKLVVGTILCWLA